MRLAYKEVNDHCASETASSEHIAVAVVNGRGDVRREEADKEVESPIAGRLISVRTMQILYEEGGTY
jgi:hypothetical protein